MPNLKFVAVPVPEIIGGTRKFWKVPEYAHAPFSPKFLRAFARIDPLNIYLLNLKFVALRVSEIIRGTPKNLGSP